MNYRNGIVRALLAVAIVTVVPQALAENPYRLKPGAAGKLCLECHVDFEETTKMSSVHTPVQTGECAGCHNPHASEHGKLLATDPESVCFECHEGIVPDDAQSVHEMVAAGDCVACHDPHASNHENNLLQTGNQLCEGCHAEITEAIATAKFKHTPVEKGCVSCHQPHGAEGASLLRTAVPALCTECHDPQRASFSQQHLGYPVGEANCTSCHDPHGSDSAGMLWASVHRPVVSKMCSQCHVDASSPNALETKAQGAQLCRGCHNKMLNETMAMDWLHWPLADSVSCGHCHTPHASPQAGLLTARPDRLCAGCHGDTLAQLGRSKVKHQPVADGECTACHSPHASNSSSLLAAESSIELCGECHDWEGHSSHPIGIDVLDPRNGNLNLDCMSCHASHGSDHKNFLHFDPGSDLCVNCHEDFGR